MHFFESCLNHSLFRTFNQNAQSDIYEAIELEKFSDGWTDDGNKRFLNYIRSRWLVAPSHGRYNLTNNKDKHFSQVGQSKFIDEVSKVSKGGDDG